MKNLKLNVIGLCILTIVSCSTNAGTGALIGTGGGAALGALAGRLIGGNTKGTLIGTAVGAAVGATAGTLIGRHMDKVKAQAKAAAANAQVDTITDENGLTGVKVTFDSGLLFGTNQSELSSTATQDLTNFSKVLTSNTDCAIVVRGHTDSTGNDAINNPLSVKRAESVAKYLNSKGVSPAQFKAVEGFGSKMPVADNTTTEGKAKNRRVEVYLFASQAMIDAANAGTLQ